MTLRYQAEIVALRGVVQRGTVRSALRIVLPLAAVASLATLLFCGWVLWLGGGVGE